MKEIVNAYNDKGDSTGVKQIQSNGVHVGGERFVVLKADERSIYGKKVCIARTFQWYLPSFMQRDRHLECISGVLGTIYK